MRTLPPPSVPRASGPAPSATAAAAPPLEPPEVRVRSCGLRVRPDCGESVTPFQPNSGVVVLPRNTAPCSRSRATEGASSSQRPFSGIVLEPLSVGAPRSSRMSLTVVGTPSTSPFGSPRRQRSVDSRACARASSAGRRTNAFTSGWIRSARSSAARVTSWGLNSPLR